MKFGDDKPKETKETNWGGASTLDDKELKRQLVMFGEQLKNHPGDGAAYMRLDSLENEARKRGLLGDDKPNDKKPKAAPKWDNPLAKYPNIDPLLIARTIANVQNQKAAQEPEGFKNMVNALVQRYNVSKKDAEAFVNVVKNAEAEDRQQAREYAESLENKKPKEEAVKYEAEMRAWREERNKKISRKPTANEQWVNDIVSRCHGGQSTLTQAVEQIAYRFADKRLSQEEAVEAVRKLDESKMGYSMTKFNAAVRKFKEVNDIIDEGKAEEKSVDEGQIKVKDTVSEEPGGKIKKAVSEVFADIFN